MKADRSTNIYSSPSKYLNELKNLSLPYHEPSCGKALVVVLPTKICHVNCEFCFYNSNANKLNFKEEQELTETGTKKAIEFINSVDTGYLMISGGGDPFENMFFITEAIEHARADKIVIVTSAYWGNNKKVAVRIIENIMHALALRKIDTSLELRISVDEFHAEKIGTQAVKNVIEVFERHNKYSNFSISLHTMQEDKTPKELIKEIGGKILPESIKPLSSYKRYNYKDGYVFITPSGLHIDVEESTCFQADLKCDLKGMDESYKSSVIKTFNDNLAKKDGNLSRIKYADGTFGLDYLISYNGNVSTWGNYHRDNAPNLYIHNANEILEKLYGDLFSYGFIMKGFTEISELVNEVNPKAVERATAMNIRDYSGASLLEENKTALYVGIRLLQLYLSQNILDPNCLQVLSKELQSAILSHPETNQNNYNEASFTIFDQIEEASFDSSVWTDTFELHRLGHYDITEAELHRAQELFRAHIKSKQQNTRLAARFNTMNPLAQAALYGNNFSRY